MKTMILVLLISISTFAIAKQKPEVTARQNFATDFMQNLELSGEPKVVLLKGKEKDILQIWLVGFEPANMIRFEKQYVELIKNNPRMKGLGFRGIQLKTEVFSITFPKGVWDIPLD